MILLTGFDRADPIAALCVAAFMLYAAIGLLRDSGRVLLEIAPAHLDVDEVGARDGAPSARHARCTTCTCGRSAAASRRCRRTCSSSRTPTATGCAASSRRCSHERFGLDHTTLQVDHAQPDGLLQIGHGEAAANATDECRYRR